MMITIVCAIAHVACDCGVIGTRMGSTCMELGGQCDCLPGVRGRQCDVCYPGTYNLTSSGCTGKDGIMANSVHNEFFLLF